VIAGLGLMVQAELRETSLLHHLYLTCAAWYPYQKTHQVGNSQDEIEMLRI